MADTLGEALLQDLKCPVCDNYMGAPIRQCAKGHSICDYCFPKVRHCPLCRAPKSQARCFVLESIQSKLMMPCRFTRTGCQYKASGSSIQGHEKFCRYSPRTCPFKSYYNCQWRDVQSKLLNHCKRRHDSNFYIAERQVFLCENFRNITSSVYYYIMIYAYGHFFRLTWDIDIDTGLTKWAVYFIGHSENAKKFLYEIEFLSDDVAVGGSVSYKAPCSALPDDDSVRFVDYNHLMVHGDIVKKYCDIDGGLSYRVTIHNGGNQILRAREIENTLIGLSVFD